MQTTRRSPGGQTKRHPGGEWNGRPVSWYGTHDWSNKRLTRDEVIDREPALLNSLRPRAEIADEADVKKMGDHAPRHTVDVSIVQTERELAREKGVGYVRLTVTDEMAPTNDEVDRFLAEVHPKLRPVETAVPGVILSGTAQGPMNIQEAVAAASAAASKVSTLLASG